ncbi:LptF/LptG family permease [Draconibacterium sp. IB214405]|uniref:LptF/LptG family permease n=1 Tax=Draconibacterium sp. IB214405 TaxID=3097352 RepID=UPI002A0C4D4A|nr:LptF/LptG family permease [Draconibacterium sp. IB214405]MDX8340538.1 LptF/LptG family permease [Draconibacterium sp. IB214405]
MKRLHLFVIKSFLGPFFMTFFIVLFVLLMQFLWRYVDDMVGKGLDLKVLAEMMFYASFAMLPLAFPLAMLLASIMTFGALGENYELVAMKASGISLFRIMRPLIVIAVLITGAAFFFSNNVLPKTNLKFSTLLYSVKKQRPELVLQEGVFTNEMDGYSIKVGKRNNDTKMLYDLLIYDHTKNKPNESVTVADSGLLRITEDKKYMVLELFHGVTYQEQKQDRNKKETYPYQRNKFEEQTIRVKVRNFEFNRRDESIFKNQYRMLTIDQLKVADDSLSNDYHDRLQKYMLQININPTISRRMFNLTVREDSLKREINDPKADTIFDYDAYYSGLDKWVQADIAKTALDRARSNMQQVNMFQGQLYNKKKNLNKYKMERHRKFTLSVAVLIFFFIGAPLGAIIRKGGLGMPVVVSIFLFILYYIVSMSGEKTAREDVWAMFNGMWFSSYIFLPVGIWLTYKAATDSAIMSSETYTKLFSRLGLDRFFSKKSKK